MWTITDNGKKKTSELIAECKKHFDVYCYWNDEELDKHFPKPEKATTRHFNKSVESEMKGQSRDDMEGKQLMTFREYAILTVQNFKETGTHLDIVGWTVFQDKLPDGLVARGRWYPGSSKVRFGWDSAGSRLSCIGGREAVSLSPSPTSSLIDINDAIRTVKEHGYKIYKEIE